MKRALLLLLLVLALPLVAGVQIAKTSPADDNYGIIGGTTNLLKRSCQNITFDATYTLDNVQFYITDETGTYVGNPEMRGYLYLDTGGDPDTLVTMFGEVACDGAGTWKNITPSGNTIVNASTPYWFCLGGGDINDADNKFAIFGDQIGTTDNVSYTTDGGTTWTAHDSWMDVEIWGTVSGYTGPSFALHSPADLSFTANSTVYFGYNVTGNDYPGDLDCNLKVYTAAIGQWKNWTSEATITINATNTFTVSNFTNETVYNWSIQCYNATDSFSDPSPWSVTIDSVNPIWTVNPSNFFAADNSTIVNPIKPGGNVVVNWNLTVADTYLEAYNVSLYDGSGAIYWSRQQTGLAVTEYNFSNTTTLLYLASGVYNVTANATDDHTSKNWKADGITTDTQSLTVETPEGNTISISNKAGNLKGITYNEEDDRISYGFDPQNARKSFTFRVECSGVLTERPHWFDTYGPTFHCRTPGALGGNWIDFHTNTTLSSVSIEQDGTDYLIFIEKAVEDDEILYFSSIGGDNHKLMEWHFTLDRTPRQAENLTVNETGYDWINLTFDTPAEANGSTLYHGNGTMIANLTQSATFHNVTGLTLGTSYNFYILSHYTGHLDGTLYNTSSSGENNITANTKGVPPMVEDFHANSTGPTWVYLTWNSSDSDIDGVEFYRNTQLIFNYTNGTMSHNDTGLSIGSSYTYRIKTWTNVSGILGYNDTINTSRTSEFTVTTTGNSSISVNVFDEDTNALITELITITVTGNNTETSTDTVIGTANFPGLLNGSYTVGAVGANYTQRTFNMTVDGGVTLNIYLVHTAETTTFTIVDADAPTLTLVDAHIIMYRYINANKTIVEVRDSDITGRAQFSYSEGARYDFEITLAGYNHKKFTLNPILFDSYTVKMTKNSTLDEYPDYAGVNVHFNPTTYYNNATQIFNISFQSPDGILTSYSYNITYPGGTGAASGAAGNGGNFTHLVNISGAQWPSYVNLTFSYDTSITTPKTFNYKYLIQNRYLNNTHLGARNNAYGLGPFEKALIATGSTILVGGIGALVGGALVGGGLGLLVLGYFTYLQFFPWWAVLISMLLGFALIARRSS